jgi:sortase (surface protein transpeptidase)
LRPEPGLGRGVDPRLDPRADPRRERHRTQPPPDNPTVYLSRSDVLDHPDYLVDDYGGYRDDYHGHQNGRHDDRDEYADDGGYRDDADGYRDDWDDRDPPDDPGGGSPNRPPSGGGRGGSIVRAFGEVLITGGMIILLFVVYELYVTNIFSAAKQASATNALDQQWGTDGSRTDHYDLADGSGIAKMYIPSLGTDYHFTVIEGTTTNDLAIGPGHYVGSALPGDPGNFAVAGHRVGQGAPFNDLGLLQSCDSVIVETSANWYVYRVLPMANEIPNWSTGKGAQPLCAGTDGDGKVLPLGGIYAQTVGQEIVLPSEGDEVATVPHHPNATIPAGQEAALMTLTTCNPQFSATQRMIVHAVLVKQYAKNSANANAMPPEMREQS